MSTALFISSGGKQRAWAAVFLTHGRRHLPSPLPPALLPHCPCFPLGSRLLGCSAPSSDYQSRRMAWYGTSHRVWDLSVRPQHWGVNGGGKAVGTQVLVLPDLCPLPPPPIMLPALSPCLPLTFAKREDWIIPPGLDIDIEINLKRVRFPCLFTKVSITHIATHTCPVTAITNEVIQNNFSEIDLGGLIWGPNHLL